MHSQIFLFLEAHTTLAYVIIFIAMIFEGDIFLFTAAFLTRQGFFDPLTMFIAVITGALTGDLFWYWLGLRLNEKPSAFTRWAKRVALPFDDHLINRTWHTLFLSKFIYGVHHAILIRAGMLKIKFSRYMEIDFLSTLVWAAVIGGLGFISSASFGFIGHSIRFIEGILLAIVLGFLIISYLISYQVKKKL